MKVYTNGVLLSSLLWFGENNKWCHNCLKNTGRQLKLKFQLDEQQLLNKNDTHLIKRYSIVITILELLFNEDQR